MIVLMIITFRLLVNYGIKSNKVKEENISFETQNLNDWYKKNFIKTKSQIKTNQKNLKKSNFLLDFILKKDYNNIKKKYINLNSELKDKNFFSVKNSEQFFHQNPKNFFILNEDYENKNKFKPKRISTQNHFEKNHNNIEKLPYYNLKKRFKRSNNIAKNIQYKTNAFVEKFKPDKIINYNGFAENFQLSNERIQLIKFRSRQVYNFDGKNEDRQKIIIKTNTEAETNIYKKGTKNILEILNTDDKSNKNFKNENSIDDINIMTKITKKVPKIDSSRKILMKKNCFKKSKKIINKEIVSIGLLHSAIIDKIYVNNNRTTIDLLFFCKNENRNFYILAPFNDNVINFYIKKAYVGITSKDIFSYINIFLQSDNNDDVSIIKNDYHLFLNPLKNNKIRIILGFDKNINRKFFYFINYVLNLSYLNLIFCNTQDQRCIFELSINNPEELKAGLDFLYEIYNPFIYYSNYEKNRIENKTILEKNLYNQFFSSLIFKEDNFLFVDSKYMWEHNGY
ncbi:hypothetical protein GVAV_002721 [Gurleya vavrai]